GRNGRSGERGISHASTDYAADMQASAERPGGEPILTDSSPRLTGRSASGPRLPEQRRDACEGWNVIVVPQRLSRATTAPRSAPGSSVNDPAGLGCSPETRAAGDAPAACTYFFLFLSFLFLASGLASGF